VKRLPSHPSLEQLKKQAKAILKGYQSADPEILQRIREHETQKPVFSLADAQLLIAREYGFGSWAKLRAHVLAPVDEENIKSLHQAARQGDLAAIGSLLDAHPEVLNETGGRGVRTALHEAVGGTQEAAVKLLLERGADPNIRCEGDNAFPLHFACEKQHFPIIRLLIEHAADPVGEGDYHELGVIGWATVWPSNPDPEIVDYLLAYGARHNLSSAVAMGEVKMIRELVARTPADLEKRMDLANKRRMPLHLAVVKKQTGALRALLELGANTESLDEAGFSALDQASLSDEAEAVQALLDHGAKIRLPAAMALGKQREMDQLLRKDPDSVKPGNRWGNLIIRASELGSAAVIEALIQAGASVDVRDDPKTSVDSTWGYTALHAAAFFGKRDAAAILLKHGANVRAREEKYRGTPAGWANYAGHTEVRDLILRVPVDVMDAIEYGLIDRVREIVREDPDVLYRPFQNYPLYPMYAEGSDTPVDFARRLGKEEMVRVLEELDSSLRRAGPPAS
jgi:ankyrin repeat protein